MPDLTSGERLRAFVLRTWKGGRGMVGLSEASGVSRERLYAWFRGEVEPTLGSLGELAKALGVRRAEVVAAIDGELPPPNWRDDLRSVIADTQKSAPAEAGALEAILALLQGEQAPVWADQLTSRIIGRFEELIGGSGPGPSLPHEVAREMAVVLGLVEEPAPEGDVAESAAPPGGR